MPVLEADRVQEALRKGATARLPDEAPPRFKVGERVIARNINPQGHTRVPRYVRGREGVVTIDHGVFILPDAHAASGTKVPERLYSVRFTADALWGPDARSGSDAVYLDLFDSYLDPVS